MTQKHEYDLYTQIQISTYLDNYTGGNERKVLDFGMIDKF